MSIHNYCIERYPLVLKSFKLIQGQKGLMMAKFLRKKTCLFLQLDLILSRVLCHFDTLVEVKVRIFWESQKIWKNLPLKIWRYSVTSNCKWKIFFQILCPSKIVQTLLKISHYSMKNVMLKNNFCCFDKKKFL